MSDFEACSRLQNGHFRHSCRFDISFIYKTVPAERSGYCYSQALSIQNFKFIVKLPFINRLLTLSIENFLNYILQYICSHRVRKFYTVIRI